MADQPKLHLGEQHARGLLAPLRAELQALERRTARHAGRTRLSPANKARLDAALKAVQDARAAIERTWEESTVPRQ
jgi:hypothetical protein